MNIHRLELLTSNLLSQQEYYSSVLELPTTLENEVLTVTTGKTTLVFTHAPVEWGGAYHFCFNIPENQFAQAKEWIAARTPLLQDDKGNDEFHSKSWNASSLYFKDAAGNILEFIARHDQTNATDEAFNSRHLLNISEIGLPSADVISFAKELCVMLNVSVYKQDYNDTFTPIGDEDGLLILPIENRIWYPNTGVPAQLLSVKVELEANGESFSIHGVPYEVERSV